MAKQPKGIYRAGNKTCTSQRKFLQITEPGNPTHSLRNNIEVEISQYKYTK